MDLRNELIFHSRFVYLLLYLISIFTPLLIVENGPEFKVYFHTLFSNSLEISSLPTTWALIGIILLCTSFYISSFYDVVESRILKFIDVSVIISNSFLLLSVYSDARETFNATASVHFRLSFLSYLFIIMSIILFVLNFIEFGNIADNRSIMHQSDINRRSLTKKKTKLFHEMQSDDTE
jgi:SNF family Na+-dependent transporter